MQDLNITLVQDSLIWENAKSNRDNFSSRLESVNSTDVIVLPEMFTTGFSMHSQSLAENMQGETIMWMRQLASDHQAAVVGSLIIEDAGYYNRLIFMRPNGEFEVYDKRHLFRMANEHEYFQAGHKRLIVDYLGWKLCLMVCYDLRFPVWSRNCNDYDALIYIANWPLARAFVWRTLLIARALENLSYVIGVNRVGQDGNQIEYGGDSSAIDMKGNTLCNLGDGRDVKTVALSATALEAFRSRFPAYLDADEFSIKF